MNFPEAVPVGDHHVAKELTMPQGYGIFRRSLSQDVQGQPTFEQEDRLMDNYADAWQRNISGPGNLYIGLFAGTQLDGSVQLIQLQARRYIQIEADVFNDADGYENLAAQGIKAVLAECEIPPHPLLIKVLPKESVMLETLKSEGFEITTDRSEGRHFTLVRQQS